MSAITIIRCQSVELVYKIGASCFLCRSVGGRCRGYRHQNNRLSNELGPVVYEGVAHVADDGRLVLSLEFWGGGQRRACGMKGVDSLKMASITLISIAVVSKPVNAHQSLTTRPAPITSEPRLTVPA